MGNRNDELAALVRDAVATAGELRPLVERMKDLSLRISDYSDEDLVIALLTVASDYSDEDLRTTASAVWGTAMMMLMGTRNASNVGGRPVGEKGPGRRRVRNP